MTRPVRPLGDWCYQVVVRCSDGHLARPNIQAPDDDDCRRRVEVLYPRATILEIIPMHRAVPKVHQQPALRIYRQRRDFRPVERRVTVRRRRVLA